ncbi:MAG: hypothetical protein J6Y02_23400 [Pseudobutyrivibrio sp.]|nr:hypothetical protein [Pseudobutyrivibrio sp.]
MLTFTRNIFWSNPNNRNGIKVFNLSSCLEGYPRLDMLSPPRQVGGYVMDYSDPTNFFNLYMQYVLSDPNAFMELMDIVNALYEGEDVFILIGHDTFRDILTESLAKLIQVRYGYIANIIMEPEDAYEVKQGTFSIFGLPNLDADKEMYWQNISATTNVDVGRGLDDYD